jgi:hypothetical protein
LPIGPLFTPLAAQAGAWPPTSHFKQRNLTNAEKAAENRRKVDASAVSHKTMPGGNVPLACHRLPGRT